LHHGKKYDHPLVYPVTGSEVMGYQPAYGLLQQIEKRKQLDVIVIKLSRFDLWVNWCWTRER
jgi:hypothetical protein